MTSYKIREAVFEDTVIINEIYNQAVDHSYQTADINPISIKETQQWFTNHDVDSYPIYVALLDNEIIGWMSLSSYRKGREALETIAEVSYYIRKDFQGKGAGSFLLSSAIEIAAQYKFKNLIAILLAPNVKSIKLLEKFGFRRWGTLPKVAIIDNQYYDHLYYGLSL